MKAIQLSLAAALTLSACKTTQPDRFAVADTNKDGKLTAVEVNDFFVIGVFTARDTNSDGKITKTEWNPAITKEETIEFNKRDANKDGVVTLEEAKTYSMKKGTYNEDVKAADKNKDGVITRDEAKAYYASKE